MKKHFPFNQAAILLVLILAGSFLLSACGFESTDQGATSTPFPTSVQPSSPEYEVKRGDVIQLMSFRARVAPVLEEELFFKTGGYVHEVYFTKGDDVKQGEVIADLEGLDTLVRQLALQDLKVQRAEINLENANLSLEMYLMTQYFQTPYKNLELQQRENAVRLAEINFEETLLQLEDLEDLVSNSQLVAPFDGKILSMSVSEGRQVSGFNPVVVVGDTSNLELSADLKSSEVSDLEVGMEVAIRYSQFPDEIIHGTIYQLPYLSTSGGVNGDSSTRIAVDLSSSEIELEIGDLVSIEIVVEIREDVLWLPLQSIRNFGGRTFVVIEEEGEQRSVDILLGIEGEGIVEILELEDQENLLEGQVVIGP